MASRRSLDARKWRLSSSPRRLHPARNRRLKTGDRVRDVLATSIHTEPCERIPERFRGKRTEPSAAFACEPTKHVENASMKVGRHDDGDRYVAAPSGIHGADESQALYRARNGPVLRPRNQHRVVI